MEFLTKDEKLIKTKKRFNENKSNWRESKKILPIYFQKNNGITYSIMAIK
jgi:hypothetical protein